MTGASFRSSCVFSCFFFFGGNFECRAAIRRVARARVSEQDTGFTDVSERILDDHADERQTGEKTIVVVCDLCSIVEGKGRNNEG